MITGLIVLKNKNKLLCPKYILIAINGIWDLVMCHYICKIFINGILFLC